MIEHRHIRACIKYWAYRNISQLKGKYRYYGQTVFFGAASQQIERACYEGVYEAHNVGVILQHLSPGGMFLDIGANLGMMAIPVLAQREDVTVISYEPSPRTAEYLSKTCDASDFTKRWEVRQIGLGSVNAEVPFYVHDEDNAIFDGLCDTQRSDVGVNQVNVSVKKLDDEWQELGRPDIGFIKIDVEGNEYEVIAGAPNLIAKTRPPILIEWYNANLRNVSKSCRDLFEICKKLDYVLIDPIRLIEINTPVMLEVACAKHQDYLMLPSEGLSGKDK